MCNSVRIALSTGAIISFEYYLPRWEITGPRYAIFSFARNCQVASQSGHTNEHARYQNMRIPEIPYSL